MPKGSPTSGPGIADSTRRFLRGLHEYVLTRWELASLESREAFGKIVIAGMVTVISIMCLVVGIVSLGVSIIYVLAEVAGWGWGWSLLIVGITLLIVMTGGLFWVRSILKGHWFPITFSEIKKDSAWLTRKTNIPE